MKKVLLSFCLLAAFCQPGLNADVKMSPSTQNFLHSYETTTAAKRSMLKSVYAVSQNKNQTVVSAFLHLNDENNLEGLEENGVVINAQYGTILSVRIPADNLEAVSQLPAVKYVEIGRPVRKLMNNVRSAAFTNADALHAGTGLSQAYTGKGVVVGVIDGGLQYNHINFYDSQSNELRLKRVWNQNVIGNAPQGYHYGTEYTTPEEIEAAQYDDEEETHATHVTGIAAGAYKGNSYYGIAPDADLVFVSYNLADNSSSNTSITDGIKYIYDYAESVGKPCVINMSLGHHFGPHDGTSTFDRICDELQGEGRLLVGAAGNEGEMPIHAQKTFTADDTTMKSLVEITPYYGYWISSIDIWGDADKDFTVKVIVYDKANDEVVYTSDAFSTTSGISRVIKNPSGSLGEVTVGAATDPNNHKGNVTLDIILESLKNNYYIGFEVSGSEGTTINSWTDASYSWFYDSGNDEFTSGDTHSTMGEIGGTGKRIISVGAYTSCNNVVHYYSSLYNRSGRTLNQLASFSSQGPTIDGRMKPDITAPGTMLVSSLNSTTCQRGGSEYEHVVSIENIDDTKYYYGSMEGTSMAAPVVTGTLATWLQARPTLTPEEVREVFSKTAKTDTFTGEIAGVGDNRWGYGKLDAYNGLIQCINLSGDVSGLDKVGAPTRPMVYPNPATTECHFLLPNDDQGVSVALYSLNGSEVYRQFVGDVQAGEQTDVALDGIAPGIYLMRITGEKSLVTTKLTVK